MRANVTRAADGFDRRSFTVAEVLRMQDAGIISEHDNLELLESDVPMHAKTHVHEPIKSALNIAIARALRDRPWLGVAIEIALTSLDYDRELKAKLYARHGVNEFWAVDAARRRTFVHNGPEADGWRSIIENGSDTALIFAALPGFSVRLASI